jgi:D-glycero-D-manno-heptose 1,7-bisphosphate phosphatase
MEKAIFLDKDGTLIQDIPYNVDPDLVRFNEGTITALKKFKNAGYLLIVVSNQSGIAHGYFPEEALRELEANLKEQLAALGVTLDDFYYCPHHPNGIIPAYARPCNCRKPKPGMLLQAAAKFNIEFSRSWMIGDILNDVEAGVVAGCKTILIDNGHETEWALTENRIPTAIACNWLEAATIILNGN